MMRTSTILLSVALVSISFAAKAEDRPFQKHPIGQFLAPACRQIETYVANLKATTPLETTRYYTPMFEPGSDGKLRPEDRYACLQMEGACLVGEYLYSSWHEQGIKRNDVPYKFGPGNAENALDPCRTIAADQKSVYPRGTVIYMPDMKGKICPQSSKPVDGCFIVDDVGHAIKGAGRFDLFTGECAKYIKERPDGTRVYDCVDNSNNSFVAPKSSAFYEIKPDNVLAVQLRKETAAFVSAGWQ